MSVICVSNLSASYGKKRVLHDVSLEVMSGEVCGLLGANGSGKSTLIKAICNVLPHAGECLICDKNAGALSAGALAKLCSYVPQKSGISIDLSVLDVVLMGFNPALRFFEEPNADMVRRAEEVLRANGMGDKLHENYMNLSEGQKQLCILLRALVADTAAVLMDEPESALDVNMRHRVMGMIGKWARERERAVLVALHDTELALNYCDRLFLLAGGTVQSVIDTKNDTPEEMEEKLSKVYGRVCVREVADRTGRKHLIMLKEEDV